MDKKILLLSITSWFIFSCPSFAGAFSLGIVSDIHAGGAKDVVRSEQNIIYASRYCINLEGIKKSGVDYILTLGDNTLNGKSSEAEKVIGCMEGYKNILWTKGNHDKEVAWQLFKTPNYYSKIIENWKIIVLDSSKLVPSGSGGFSDEQMAWLENELNGADGAVYENVLIAMHHTVFVKSLLFPKLTQSEIIFPQFFQPVNIELSYPIYEKFRKIVESNKKIKYVYSGHVHTSNRCFYVNDVNYCSVPSVSIVKNEGYFKELLLK